MPSSFGLSVYKCHEKKSRGRGSFLSATISINSWNQSNTLSPLVGHFSIGRVISKKPQCAKPPILIFGNSFFKRLHKRFAFNDANRNHIKRIIFDIDMFHRIFQCQHRIGIEFSFLGDSSDFLIRNFPFQNPSESDKNGFLTQFPIQILRYPWVHHG